jgi:nicotinate phosphoribosyltransferase
MDIQAYAKKELATFWDEYRRLMMPHRYKVDLSEPLYTLKQDMLRRPDRWKA